MNDEQLKTLMLLAAVERAGNFAAAARELKTTRARISRLINQAEQQLNIRLCHRTTRQVVLTDAAKNLVQAVNYHLDSINAAVSALSEDETQLRGLIRVSVSHAFGRLFVTPVITEFMRAHPQVRIEYNLSDKIEHLTAQAIDIAIRIGPLPDSDIVARPLGRITAHLVAAPSLLSNILANPTKFPTTDLNALDGIPSIGFKPVSVPQARAWLFEHKGKQINYHVHQPMIEVSSIETLADLVKAGVGMSVVPDYLIQDALDKKEVIKLLKGFNNVGPEVHLCYSNRALIPMRVRKLIDKLLEDITEKLRR